MQKFYTLAEFARIVGHDNSTVKDKIQRGKVKTVPVVNGLNRRNTYILSESELRKYMETYCKGLKPAEKTDQYKCSSYVEDEKVINCTCGMCIT